MVMGNRGRVDGASARGKGRRVILSVRRGSVIDPDPAVVVSDVTGLVRLSVGWLERLQNRNRFGALIGLQPVGFGSFRLTG